MSSSRRVAASDVRLFRAYRRAAYVSAGIVVHVGRPVPDALLDRLGTDVAVFLTAWNPQSRRMPAGWNRRMQQRLRERLRHFAMLEAESSLHRWREPMLLVAGDPNALICVARSFRQRAVVVLGRGHRVRLASTN